MDEQSILYHQQHYQHPTSIVTHHHHQSTTVRDTFLVPFSSYTWVPPTPPLSALSSLYNVLRHIRTPTLSLDWYPPPTALTVDVDFSLEIRDRDDTFSFLFFFMITDCYLTYRFLHVEHSHRIARTHASIPLSQLYDLGQFPTSRTLFFASFVRPVFGFRLIRIVICFPLC